MIVIDNPARVMPISKLYIISLSMIDTTKYGSIVASGVMQMSIAITHSNLLFSFVITLVFHYLIKLFNEAFTCRLLRKFVNIAFVVLRSGGNLSEVISINKISIRFVCVYCIKLFSKPPLFSEL